MLILDKGRAATTRRQAVLSLSSFIRCFALGAAAACLLAGCAQPHQVAAAQQGRRDDIAVSDASKSSRTALGMVVTWTRSILARLPHPETTQWEQLLANADGSVVCLEFRSRTDASAYDRQRVVYVDGVASSKPAAWELNCTQGLHNVASPEYLIAAR
ncbi:MAG: hypothetical protein HZC24_14140 [Rhodocyclales bacterium]|nr:hypothetical protein [Rhodocyclales bacterium]